MKLADSLKHEISHAYDAQVAVYESRRFEGIGGKLLDKVEKIHALKWLKHCNVLHIGTATGRFAELLPEHGFSYYGIEISRRMAHASKARTHGSTEIIRGDGECLPLSSSSFDNVLSVRSFHFLPEPDRFIREASRVLQPHGRLVVSFEMYNRIGRFLEIVRLLPRGKPSRTLYRISEVKRFFANGGFSIHWSGKVTKFPLNFYWKAPRPILRIVCRFHPILPSWFGTVGSVVGEKL